MADIGNWHISWVDWCRKTEAAHADAVTEKSQQASDCKTRFPQPLKQVSVNPENELRNISSLIPNSIWQKIILTFQVQYIDLCLTDPTPKSKCYCWNYSFEMASLPLEGYNLEFATQCVNMCSLGITTCVTDTQWTRHRLELKKHVLCSQAASV